MRNERSERLGQARIVCSAVALAVACIGYSASVCAANGNGRQALQESLESLGQGDVQSACNLWTELLREPWPYSAVALHQMEMWHEACSMSAGLSRTISAVLAVSGGDVTRWRSREVAWALWKKWSPALEGTLPQTAASLEPKLTLVPQEERFWGSPIPFTLSTTGVPTAEPEGEAADGFPQEGGLRRSTWYLYTPVEGAGIVGVAANGPAAVWLDGRPLGYRANGRPTSEATPWLLSAHYKAGCHRVDLVELAEATGAGKPIAAYLPAGATAAERCEPVSGWSRTLDAPKCVGADWVCALAELAESQPYWPGREALYRRIAQMDSPLLVLALLRSTSDLGPGFTRVEAALEGATKGQYCTLDLLWARKHIQESREELAADILGALSQTCMEISEAHLAQIELAIEQGFYPLAVRLADDAHALFPLDCRITAEWARGLSDRGEDYFSIPSHVACPALEVELRNAQERWDVARDARLPDSYVLPELAPGWIQRKYLVEKSEGEASAKELIRELSKRYPGLLHNALALTLGQTLERTTETADAIRQVPGAWSWERAVAGRFRAWGEAMSLARDPFAVVRAFQANGFSKGSSQVVVLDETVGLLEDHGWLTAVETQVLFLNSPTAVEGVGEVTLESGRERLLAGVLKADGTWHPAVPSQVGGGETLSFKGLAPGDFYVLRTVKETPAEFSAGSCHQIGRHSFGNRSMPVYEGRLVLRMETPDLWSLQSTPGLQLQWPQPDTAVVEVRQLPPIPLEPGAADRLDGLEMVEIQSRCLTWPVLRDAMADRLLSRCDAPFPSGLADVAADPVKLVARVGELLEGDSSAWDTRDVSQVWADGRGSAGLAAWCALMAAGYDAWPVVVNPPTAGSLDWKRPGFSRLEGTAIRLNFQGEELFLSAGGKGQDPRVLPASWQGRDALLLRPLDGRLTVRLPQEFPVDEQQAWVRLRVDKAHRVTGELRLEVQGFGSGQMALQMDQMPEDLELALANYVRHFLANAVPLSHSFTREGRKATLVVAFRLETPVRGALRILLPPRPASELTAVASRTQPLAFSGLMPTRLDVRVQADSGVTLSTKASSETIDGGYGHMAVTVEGDDDEVRIQKELWAKASRVEPADYRLFAEFIGGLQRRASMEVWVK